MAEVRGGAAGGTMRRLFRLPAALLLAGCAAVGGPAGDVAPPRSASFALNARNSVDLPHWTGPSVEGVDGASLPLSTWEAETPRAVLLAVHGFGDYGLSTYKRAAVDWAQRGITTYAYDQRGFGRGVTRGQWPGAETLVADLRAVARALRKRHPCLPIAVVGHSMGGGVAAAAAGSGLEADGVVLAAPAVWGGEYLNPIQRMAAWTAAAIVPDRRFGGGGLVRIQATDNIALLNALAADPYYLGQPSAREIMGLVRVTDLAEAAMPRIRMPALLLLGEKDEIVPNAKVLQVFGQAAGPTRVIEYPEGWHLLFRDLQAPRVWQDVADFALALGPADEDTCDTRQASR